MERQHRLTGGQGNDPPRARELQGRVRLGEWRALQDSNLRPPGS
jgi:hypothetical protein